MDQRQLDDSLRSLARDMPLSVTVRGRCMRPLFDDGACLSIVPVKIYWPGDVIVFRRTDKQLISHRLLAYYRRHGELKYLTQADSGAKPDRSISYDQILGKVVGGECHIDAIKIPLKQRLNSIYRMMKFSLSRFLSTASRQKL